ncbi:hypothetical protein WN51_13312 [Melipona quadrifasciata]|uniref:Uncharacterized protein n=1 Tax=Melipona quadrifasciata TaxID=166423 RepID=A0A0N0U5H7_9HYME|nr:hypothetical protein WN51_13312 [Melipona quadrifasciata]
METFQTSRANIRNNLDINLDIALIDPEESAIERCRGEPRAKLIKRFREDLAQRLLYIDKV